MRYISVIALLVIEMMTLAQEPMKIEEKNSAQYRWLNKEVLETRILDNMEDKIQWTSFTGGAIGLADSRIERKSEEAKRDFVNLYSSQIRSHTGEKSILIRFPAKFEVPGPKSGRGWGTAGIRYKVQNEDWTKFNRISVWIYPDNPGAYKNAIVIRVFNDGVEKLPAPFGQEGESIFNLKNHQWNHIIWETGNVARDKITHQNSDRKQPECH